MYREQKVTFHSAAGATATGTVLNCAGMSSLVVQISGSFSATVTWQASVDGTNYIAIQAENMASGAVATTATAAGLYRLSVAGLRLFRANMTWVSGTSITATGLASAAPVDALADVQLAANSGVDIGDVDVLSIATGSNAIGKLAANSGVDIGDVDVTSVPTALQGPGNPTVDSYSCAVINAAAAANQVLVAAPGANKQIWVYGLFMMADTGAGTVTLQDDADTALSGTMAVSDEGGWVLPISGNFAMPWVKCTTNKALEADCATCTIDGIICYGIVSV